MTKTKITVTTPLGTFTRTTARQYSHVVVVSDAHAGPGSPWTAAGIERSRTPGALAWSGSLAGARKAATSGPARFYHTVRIFEVATGVEVTK